MKKLNINADDVITSGNLAIGGGLTIADTGFLRLVDDGNGNVSLMLNGEVKPIECIISGTWMFNGYIQNMDKEDYFSENVIFTAGNGNRYSSISFTTGMVEDFDPETGEYLSYDYPIMKYDAILTAQDFGSNQIYRPLQRITFEGEQIVSPEFLRFMNYNAHQVEFDENATMITFRVLGNQFGPCPEGMIWNEYMLGPYDLGDAYTEGSGWADNSIYVKSGSGNGLLTYQDGDYVSPDDVIRAGYDYSVET